MPALPSEVTVHGRCDFCSADDPAWYIPARPFMVDAGPGQSSDDWAACDTCVELVRADRWTELRRHAVTRLVSQRPRLSPAEADRLGAHMSRLWRQLRPNITGAPGRIGPGR